MFAIGAYSPLLAELVFEAFDCREQPILKAKNRAEPRFYENLSLGKG